MPSFIIIKLPIMLPRIQSIISELMITSDMICSANAKSPPSAKSRPYARAMLGLSFTQQIGSIATFRPRPIVSSAARHFDWRKETARGRPVRRRGTAALNRDPNRRRPNTLVSCARRKPWSIPRRVACWGSRARNATHSQFRGYLWQSAAVTTAIVLV